MSARAKRGKLRSSGRATVAEAAEMFSTIVATRASLDVRISSSDGDAKWIYAGACASLVHVTLRSPSEPPILPAWTRAHRVALGGCHPAILTVDGHVPFRVELPDVTELVVREFVLPYGLGLRGPAAIFLDLAYEERGEPVMPSSLRWIRAISTSPDGFVLANVGALDAYVERAARRDLLSVFTSTDEGERFMAA